jgi:hypothetical protein
MRNKSNNFHWLLALLICFLVYGCNRSHQLKDHPSQNEVASNGVSTNNSAGSTNSRPKSSKLSLQQRIQFNLGKLKDRSYTDTYGHGYIWYTAAEELGKIGKPAVPHLIRNLDTHDQYELKLTLYALQLATQDTKVKSLTNGEYINLKSATSEEHNAENKRVALQWWEKYKHNFTPHAR